MASVGVEPTHDTSDYSSEPFYLTVKHLTSHKYLRYLKYLRYIQILKNCSWHIFFGFVQFDLAKFLKIYNFEALW